MTDAILRIKESLLGRTKARGIDICRAVMEDGVREGHTFVQGPGFLPGVQES